MEIDGSKKKETNGPGPWSSGPGPGPMVPGPGPLVLGPGRNNTMQGDVRYCRSVAMDLWVVDPHRGFLCARILKAGGLFRIEHQLRIPRFGLFRNKADWTRT